PFPSGQSSGAPRHLRPFPTRRSSDLATASGFQRAGSLADVGSRTESPARSGLAGAHCRALFRVAGTGRCLNAGRFIAPAAGGVRSEEHTSELQSRENLVCRLLLEKKK